jgi:hypothetical protein
MTHNGNVIHQIVPFKMSNYNQWEVGHRLFEAIVNPPLEVPFLDMDESIRFYMAKI